MERGEGEGEGESESEGEGEAWVLAGWFTPAPPWLHRTAAS